MSTLVITQVKSANGTNGRQRDTLRSLGLRGIGKTVERPDSEPLRGMVHAVRHLVVCRGEVMSEQDAVNEELAAEAVGLHSLKPAPGSKKDRKRVGRGHGSGHGKTSGRGHKGYNSRAGAKQRARFEGGQNPLHMRMRKLRGPNKKMSMPFEMFRTHTQHVNLDDLEARFDDGASIGLAELKSTGLAKARDVPVKILGRGELTKKFTVAAPTSSRRALARRSRAPAAPSRSSRTKARAAA